MGICFHRPQLSPSFHLERTSLAVSDNTSKHSWMLGQNLGSQIHMWVIKTHIPLLCPCIFSISLRMHPVILQYLFYSNCMLKLEEPSHSSSPLTTFPSSPLVRFENQVAWNKLCEITSKAAFFFFFLVVSFSPAIIYIIQGFFLLAST